MKSKSNFARLKDYLSCALALGAGPASKFSIFWKQTKNVRVRLGLAKYHPDEIYTLDTIYGKLHFRDNFGDITNLVPLLYHGEYRLRKLSGQGAILDAGANIGLAAVWFAYHNRDRAIYCFEPLASNTRMIRLNCPTAHVEQVALGQEAGAIQLRVDPSGVMASAIPCQWETEDSRFEVRSLDIICEENRIEEIALLKLDVEGMEMDVLKGAQATLSSTHQVVLETHSSELHREVIAYLQEAGFRIDLDQFYESTGLLMATRR